MLYRSVLVWLSCLLCMRAQAQTAKDSTFAIAGKAGFIIPYKVAGNTETVFTLARRYHTPPAVIADMNKLGFQSPIKDGSYVLIPVASFNYLDKRPATGNDSRPLYYKVSKDDNLGKIAGLAQLPKRYLQDWNYLKEEPLAPGRVLLVGWVAYDPSTAPVTETVAKAMMAPAPPKPADTTPDVEKVYLQQTDNEEHVTSEKGAAVFFNATGKNKEFFFGFHNSAPKGSIIRVVNPGNGKFVYVKVLGAMPKTKQYVNAVIGISAMAKEPLGVVDDKAWCELSYGDK